MKKRLKKFFTLSRNHDGFTLVELIVVIAVLAILAGAGTVGYSGYIKSANKKADMVLVGNIMRAIETGAHSYIVELEQVLQASEKGAKLPIGFVVLTKDGLTVMESASTQMAVTANDPCKIESVTLYRKTFSGTDKYNDGCNDIESDVYVVTEVETVSICTTHSNIPTENIRVWNNGVPSDTDAATPQSNTAEYPMRDGGTLVLPGNGHEDGQKLVVDNYYQFANGEGEYTTANNQGAIMDALRAAFGDNLNVKLKHDGWTVSTIPNFWSNATDTWENVKKLSDMMYDLTHGLGGDAIAGAMDIGIYDSSSEVVYSVANAVKGSFADKQAFVDQWATYGQYGETEEKHGGDNFGINESVYTGREYYSAMRAAYNNCVASYVKTHHAVNGTYTLDDVDAHVADLASYGESAGDLVADKVGGGLGSIIGGAANMFASENFPHQLCKASFATAGGQAYGGDAGTCAECYRCYKEYISTGTDKADAAAVYDTFMTAADTDPAILDGNLTDAAGNNVDFFSYYKNYLKEFEGMYSAATGLANGESSIVVQIYYEDNKLSCEVSPPAANPRKN